MSSDKQGMDVRGIRSGAALIRVPDAEVGFLVFRALTFDQRGAVTVTDVELTPDDALRLLDGLNAALSPWESERASSLEGA